MVDNAGLVARYESGLALAVSDPCGGCAGAATLKIAGRAGASVASSAIAGTVRPS